MAAKSRNFLVATLALAISGLMLCSFVKRCKMGLPQHTHETSVASIDCDISDPHLRRPIQSPKSQIPDSSFYVFQRRFLPVCASLNRGFRGLPIEYMSLHRSGQIWRLYLNHFRYSANDLNTIAIFGQNGVVTYTQLVSLCARRASNCTCI